MLEMSIKQSLPVRLDAALKCKQGEVLALVGPSGSGKTTVLRSIAGLNTPDSGLISCEGHSWFDSSRALNLSPQKRQVGMVFQNYALFPHLTVAENLNLALQHSTNGRTVSIGSLLDKVHLLGLEQRYPSQLSGGQQQRVALARALARNPDVLLLDEPFSAVDKVTRRKLYLELHGLRRQLNMPIVLVTHDLDEAAMLADSMCVIHQGKTLQQGSPDAVLHRPENVAIARQVDVRNLFEGELEFHDGQLKLRWHDYVFELSQSRSLLPGKVYWTIPPSKVLLHQRLRPSHGEHENPVTAVVFELLSLRGISTVVLRVDNTEGELLQMDIPEHAANRNNLQIGDTVSLSLLASALHLMPFSA
jgi:molybdate transport system ATP-binding protein